MFLYISFIENNKIILLFLKAIYFKLGLKDFFVFDHGFYVIIWWNKGTFAFNKYKIFFIKGC
jgi:hypothetical protein